MRCWKARQCSKNRHRFQNCSNGTYYNAKQSITLKLTYSLLKHPRQHKLTIISPLKISDTLSQRHHFFWEKQIGNSGFFSGRACMKRDHRVISFFWQKLLFLENKFSAGWKRVEFFLFFFVLAWEPLTTVRRRNAATTVADSIHPAGGGFSILMCLHL